MSESHLDPGLRKSAQEGYSSIRKNNKNILYRNYEEAFEGLRRIGEPTIGGEDLIKNLETDDSSSIQTVLTCLQKLDLVEYYNERDNKSTFLAGYTNEDHEWILYEDEHWDVREDFLRELIENDEYFSD